ncbi:hypothetical protein L7F22_053342 [Adiantum nelumboides]|nr:hypothetical protein [Adiantum nelumboides]
MASLCDEQAGLASIEDESLQEIARKLPEGDALPDGFSECPTGLESEVPLGVSAVESAGSLQRDYVDPYGVLTNCERSSTSSGSSNASTELNDGTPCGISISPKKKRERLRSFPVQLSSAENPEEEIVSGTHVEVEEHVPLQEGNLSIAGDCNPCAQNIVDPASIEETRDALTLETRSAIDSRDAEQDASPEIDQLIHGTALSEHKLSYAHTQRCGKLLPGVSHTFWEPAVGDHLSSGGVCISVGSHWLPRVIDHGTLVAGRVMWVSLQCDASVVGILCIYAPTTAAERSWFWDQIVHVLPTVDSWIVGGDFNNVETFEDWQAVQPPALPHIVRCERDAWDRFLFALAGVDVWHTPPLHMRLVLCISLGAFIGREDCF